MSKISLHASGDCCCSSSNRCSGSKSGGCAYDLLITITMICYGCYHSTKSELTPQFQLNSQFLHNKRLNQNKRLRNLRQQL